ncbi:uncharacterized protein BP5553_07106 [Venustampulla echinocandica]|uniref:Protein kinase domain-containing protein n=1 Tax=Venustampulla echinocandica TaxID=2656787 RepID=A0A370TIK1_9HELO|nr:uncharacterized protein BP5553_07106 [Venustampulla echinocandica]RDL35175.1 hypothetical protein BP5553_07106 [Venustampulla echinocandica]
MVSLISIGSQLGQGGRARVWEAATSEGQVIALKAYWKKRHSQDERIAYKHLQELGLAPTYLPRYYGPVRFTRDNLRSILYYKQPAIYRTGVAIERVKGLRLDKRLMKDMSDEELRSLEERLLAALSDLHNNGICHRDIKGDNILLAGSQHPWGFVIIDFSDAITRKSTPYNAQWKSACSGDRVTILELFKDARSSKAVIAGCQLIQDTISALPSNTSEVEISDHFNQDLQVQLSELLVSARSGYTVTLPTLVDRILSTIKHPVPQLGLPLVCALRSLGRNDDALCIVEDCIAAGFAESNASLIPSFDYQKALILKLHNSKPLALRYFNSALSGFEKQLGPDHITTQSCRYDLALHHISCGDLITAKTMLVSIAEVIRAKKRKTNSEKHLLQHIGWNLRAARFDRIRLEENDDALLVEVTVDTKVKP